MTDGIDTGMRHGDHEGFSGTRNFKQGPLSLYIKVWVNFWEGGVR